MASESPQNPARELTPEQLAFLVGGSGRAPACALAALLDRGVLRVNRDGWVTRAGGELGLTPLEAAVMSAVGVHPVKSGEVVGSAARSVPAKALGDELRELGLLPRPSIWRRLTGRRAGRSQWLPAPGSEFADSRLVQDRWVGTATLTSAAGLVAIGGIAAYPDGDQADAVLKGYAGAPPAGYAGGGTCAATFDGGGGGGGDSGGSCGGGSCGGGGGGGGCGGGGGGGCGGGS